MAAAFVESNKFKSARETQCTAKDGTDGTGFFIAYQTDL
jgi:hypothetical protein